MHSKSTGFSLLKMRAQAYDSHCNVVLGEVEETIYMIEEEEDGTEAVKVSTKYAVEGLAAIR